MTSQTNNAHRLAFCSFAAVLTAALFAAGASPVATQSRASAPQVKAPRIAASITPDAQGKVDVTVLLTKTTLISKLPEKATALLTTSKGSTAARRAAIRNPLERSPEEDVAASIAEASRNAALPMIRSAARQGQVQSERVARLITKLGGTVTGASPLPNQLTATLPKAKLAALAASSDVKQIVPAATPHPMSSPWDGSATWRANGFTGQGSSADGKGSPDFVMLDTGSRTTHDAFRSRLLGDCPTCDGTGPSRIISPTVRTDFSGSKHANTIAAQVARTQLSSVGGTGMAYGIDKFYDNRMPGTYDPYLWQLGIQTLNEPGLAGNDDLPEVINFSQGIYEDFIDYSPYWNYVDALEANYGILQTVSAGNCGIATPSYTNCGDGPHRVSTPTTSFNVLSVGGLDTTSTYPDTSGYKPWDNTSPGPTYGGRKKPDLIAPPYGTAGTPSAIADTGEGGGMLPGTSFAAPVAASGALLLASTGVYLPTAQKAIMINTTTPVQGQTYWKPRSGWGALNLETAFYQRGNYANGSVHGGGPNSARFFSTSGVSVGNRTTLVWNRRTTTGTVLNPAYYNLTNLDLSQIDPGTAAVTSTGGSDAADTVDKDQTVTVDNPMPGNGADGEDNVEQIRSTATGNQLIKVKALSSIDGAQTEPFSIASKNPVTALATPIPNVTVTTDLDLVAPGDPVTITATSSNPSADLSLESAQATITLPAGATLTSGSATQSIGTMTSPNTYVKVWTATFTGDGAQAISVTTSGSKHGESFAGNGSDSVTVDGGAPELTADPWPQYSADDSPAISWSASDTHSTVASFDADYAVSGGPWSPLLSASTATNLETAPATDNQLVSVRIRARDSLGNTSGWSEFSTTVDTSAPSITAGSISTTAPGRIQVPFFVTNTGAPLTTSTATLTQLGRSWVYPLVSGQPVVATNENNTSNPATITATAVDSLGRAATRVVNLTVPPGIVSPRLRLTSVRTSKGKTTIKGTTLKTATSTLKLTIKRTSRKGTKKVVKKVRPKNGNFHVRLKLRKGKYRITASYPETRTYVSQTISKRFTVK